MQEYLLQAKTQNIGKWIEGKQKLFVLNKCDLASESENKKDTIF